MPIRQKTVGYILKPRNFARVKEALDRLAAKRARSPDRRALNVVCEEIKRAEPLKEVTPT